MNSAVTLTKYTPCFFQVIHRLVKLSQTTPADNCNESQFIRGQVINHLWSPSQPANQFGIPRNPNPN